MMILSVCVRLEMNVVFQNLRALIVTDFPWENIGQTTLTVFSNIFKNMYLPEQ